MLHENGPQGFWLQEEQHSGKITQKTDCDSLGWASGSQHHSCPQNSNEEPGANAIWHPQHLDSFEPHSTAAFMSKEEKTW